MHFGLKRFFCFVTLAALASIFALPSDAQTNASQRRRANRQRRAQAAIQETYNHRYEVLLGGAYLRFRPGSTLRHSNEIGFEASGTRYFSQRLGLTADIHGYYGRAYTYPNQFAIFSPSIHEYIYQVGPAYRFYAQQRFSVSAHVVAGAASGGFAAGTNHIPPRLIGIYPAATVFAASPGVSFDYNIDPALAVRVTPELQVTRFGGEWQFNRGVSFGILYRFGQL